MKKYLLLVALILPFIFSGCTEEDEPELIPVVTTVSVDEITSTSVWASIKTENLSPCQIGSNSRVVGFVYATSTEPTITSSKTVSPNQCVGGTNLKIEGLTPKTKYYIRAFVTQNGQTIYGNELTFTTL